MVIFLLLATRQVLAECIFTQTCPPNSFQCSTPHRIDPIPPFPINYTGPYACPMFAGQDVCCSQDQNKAMFQRFTLLDTTFGHIVGGCDICAANMKLMWCYFTCAADQNRFVSAGEQRIIPSPANPQQMIKVLLLNYTVTDNLACQLYESCKKCPYVTQVSAMQSPQGFLEFQGYEGASIGLTWTTFYLNNGEVALNLDFQQCTSPDKNVYGYKVEPCSCNNCEQSCAGDYYASAPSTLHGFDWKWVVVSYSVLAFASLVVFFGRLWWMRRKQRRV